MPCDVAAELRQNQWISVLFRRRDDFLSIVIRYNSMDHLIDTGWIQEVSISVTENKTGDSLNLLKTIISKVSLVFLFLQSFVKVNLVYLSVYHSSISAEILPESAVDWQMVG